MRFAILKTRNDPPWVLSTEHNREHPPDALPAEDAEPVAEVEADAAHDLAAAAAALEHKGRSGANWFYWVAGLSLVNSSILLAGGGVFFVIGLGITQVAGVIANEIAKDAPNAGPYLKAFVFGFGLFIALVVAGFGWLAGKRYQVVFAIGMVLYLLDGLLFVFVGDWMSVAFHAFALFGMWSGFRAYRQLAALEKGLKTGVA
jgi:hypothetical protein